MSVTAAFSRLLDLSGTWVRDVAFEDDTVVVVSVALRRRRLVCPECSFSTAARYDVRPEGSCWRHLDLGTWRLELRAELRRLHCPEHRVRTEGADFARPGARYNPRLRRPGRLLGHHHGQERHLPAARASTGTPSGG